MVTQKVTYECVTVSDAHGVGSTIHHVADTYAEAVRYWNSPYTGNWPKTCCNCNRPVENGTTHNPKYNGACQVSETKKQPTKKDTWANSANRPAVRRKVVVTTTFDAEII